MYDLGILQIPILASVSLYDNILALKFYDYYIGYGLDAEHNCVV